MTPTYEDLQEQVRYLRDQLADVTGKDLAASIRAVTGLTFRQSRVVAMLYSCPGVVSTEALYDGAIADPATGEGPSTGTLRAHISMARKVMLAAGAPEAPINPDLNFGYRMSAATRAWLRDRLSAPDLQVAA